MRNIVKLPLKLFKSAVYRCRRWYYKRKESGNMKGLRFSQVTAYANGNAGDTVLSQCVRREFQNTWNDLGWNIIDVNKKVSEHTIHEINKTKALIIGGGGLFLPDTNPNDISGWQWAVSGEQLSLIEVPIIVYSVGYNYFPGQKVSQLFQDNLAILCDKASFIGLRNYGSVFAVKDLLPEDLAKKIVYQPCTTTLIRKLYGDMIPPKKATGKIAFNLAFDREERRYRDYKDQICVQIAKAAYKLARNGYEIYIVLHCENDKEIIPYMEQQGVHVTLVNLSRGFPEQIYQFYNEMDCVIGMRGHSQMIPFGLNCEIISLGTHDKMKWFTDDIEAPDWYINLIEEKDDLSDIILERFKIIHEEKHEETQKRLLAAQDKLWNITQKNMINIKNIIT